MTVQHLHMDYQGTKSEFPELARENLEIWNANAAWWDDRIGGGNEVQKHLLATPSAGLLPLRPGDCILEIASGARPLIRRGGDLGGRGVGTGHSTPTIDRRQR